MRSAYLTNLLLLIITILLVWFMTQPQSINDNQYISDHLKVNQIDNIEIHRQDQQNIQLQLAKQWQLIQPVNVRANHTRIKLLLNLLEQPVRPPINVTDKTNLSEFGLAKPKLTLLMNQQPFVFGDIESLSGDRYILHQQQIFLIHDEISPLLTASASSFVDNRLLDPATQIQTIQLPKLLDTHAEISIYQQNAQWHSKPKNYNQDALLNILQNWQQAYAMQVMIINDSVNTDNMPAIIIKLNDETQRKFFISHNEQSLTLTDPQQQLQYQFPATITNALFPLDD